MKTSTRFRLVSMFSCVFLLTAAALTLAQSPPPVSFVAATAFNVGANPYSVAVGDFNGDGKPDLVVADGCGDNSSCSNGTLSVLPGNGNGTFQTAVSYSVGYRPTSVIVGDFNGDGRLDIAASVACGNDSSCGSTSGTISVLLGKGDGTFQPPTSYAAGLYPESIAIGDFNGDSKLDLVVSNSCANYPGCQSTGSISVLLGNGDGSFQPAVSYDAGPNPVSVAVGDFNGDGWQDLAVANNLYSGTVSVLPGNGDGTFGAPVGYAVGEYPQSVAVGDFTGDRKPDLAVANTYYGVSLLLGQGDGTFQPQVDLRLGTNVFLDNEPKSVVVGDFNGDGRLDFAVANDASTNVSVVLGNGDGTFQAGVNYAAGFDPVSVAAADFNGDGRLDLVTANRRANTVGVLMGNGDGTFQAAVDYPSGDFETLSLTLGDFNGDGKLDLATANSGHSDGTVSVLLGNGNGTFQLPVNYASADLLQSQSVTTGDFNSDGKLDLAVANICAIEGFCQQPDGTVSVRLGTGDGSFREAASYAAGPSPIAVATGDVNGDGKLDLVVVDNGDSSSGNVGSMSVLFGKGDGTFQTPVAYSDECQPTSVALGDFNGDGKLDLVLGNTSCNTVSVFLGKGDGTFQPAVDYPTGAESALSVAVADLNGDSKPDLAVANSGGCTGGGCVSVLLGNGNGTFQSAKNYNVGPTDTSMSVAVGDLNGDGKPDLAVTGGCSDTCVSVLLGEGDGTFQPAANYTAGLDAGTVVVRDLNGDGRPDLAVVNSGSGDVTALLNTTKYSTSTSLLASANPSNIGQDVTFTATVTSSDGTPSGTVSFLDGATLLATTSLNNGTAAFSTSDLAAGSHSITAAYSGDATFNGSSGALVEDVPPAVVALSANRLAFGKQIVGSTSAQQTVTLSNTGMGDLDISSIAASGDYGQTNTCGAAVAAGDRCTIDVRFKPTAIGARTGALTITDNNNGTTGSTQTVSLSGLGEALAQSPTATVDFFGDGEGEPAVWRPSNGTWYVHSNSNSGGSQQQVCGLPGDVLVAADYDGDGKSDYAVWRPSTGTWFIIPSSNPTNPITEQWGSRGDVPVPADYDGDGKSDIAVWRPGNGTWYVLPSNGGGEITKQYGQAGDVPVIGDYDGDGKADYAVWRPSNGTWYVLLSSTGKSVSTPYGSPGDIPVEGDYDGDGKTDYAVWRPSNGMWYVLLSSTGKSTSTPYGTIGDIPVVGDYNGDGKNDYAVFRPSNGTWYVKYSSGGSESIQYGATGDIPATHLPSMIPRDKHIANFDGDRKADIGFFRPSTGTWYVIDSSTGKSTSQAYGANGDLIVPGDYDGDGKTDYAVWRPSNQTWYVTLSSTGKSVNQQWGASGDIPVPGDYDGDGKTDYALFRDGTWHVILSSTGTSVKQSYGTTGDIPVPADYDGDGKTDYAIWRPSTETWYVLYSSTGASVHQQWGASGDIPVPGDYDGDTKADYTVFRPSDGTWHTIQSSNGKTITTSYGTNGDIPVARDYDGDEKTDIAVFRPSNGTWYILQSSSGKSTQTIWGLSTDVPVNKPTGQ